MTSDNSGSVTALNVDVNNCDREQIQFSSAVQPHGVMLVLSLPELRILQASANTADLLGTTPGQTPQGKTLEDVLGSQRAKAIQDRLAQDPAVFASRVVHLTRTDLPNGAFDVFAHCHDGIAIVEIEQVSALATLPLLGLYSDLQATVAQLHAGSGLLEVINLAVQQVRKFTGYDRVMAYKFLDDHSGDVVAESVGDGLEPYLGLRYPASDIPAPARKLFEFSLLRHLPDVAYQPVPLIPAMNPLTGGPVDLSRAMLRSVSVMYSGYLKNMGAQSTMVLPLLKQGRLWGLISCMHHAGPRHVGHEIRVATEFLVTTLSLLLADKENIESFEYRLRMSEAAERLVRRMANELVFYEGLIGDDFNILSCADAGGAALLIGDELVLIGYTPTEAQVRSVAAWLETQANSNPTYVTDRLPERFAEAAGFVDTAAGLLATRLTYRPAGFLMWFRPEVIETVSWAGDPEKPLEATEANGKLLLSPRHSFELYKQTVRGRSKPWQTVEVEAVTGLRQSVVEVVLRQSEELQRINRELVKSNIELDSFAYIASHDLKEPLRGIYNFSALLMRSHADRLGDDGKGRLETVLRLTRRMDDLIESLLHYSRVGRTDLLVEDIDLDELVNEALTVLRPRILDAGAEIRRPRRLPRAPCDRARVLEVFVNLISNALKYNDKDVRWVEIGYNEGRSGLEIYVRDNGIGVEAEHRDRIFQIFKRLHGKAEYGGGSGVGLTIARRTVERHGGHIWMQSEPDAGSTFWFTLADPAAAQTGDEHA